MPTLKVFLTVPIALTCSSSASSKEKPMHTPSPWSKEPQVSRCPSVRLQEMWKWLPPMTVQGPSVCSLLAPELTPQREDSPLQGTLCCTHCVLSLLSTYLPPNDLKVLYFTNL